MASEVSAEGYFARVGGALCSWTVALGALNSFRVSEDATREFLTRFSGDVVETVKSLSAEAPGEVREAAALMAEELRFEANEEWWRRSLIRDLDTVVGHVNAAYLLVFAALVEDLLNQCVLALFLDNPVQMDPDGKKQIMFGDLLQKGGEGVVRAEAERRVRRFSNETIESKIAFLKARFGIGFLDEVFAIRTAWLIGRRNELLHEKPGTAVPEDETRQAHFLAYSIGRILLGQMALLDPLLVEDHGKEHLLSGPIEFNRFPDLRRYKTRRDRQQRRDTTPSEAAVPEVDASRPQ